MFEFGIHVVEEQYYVDQLQIRLSKQFSYYDVTIIVRLKVHIHSLFGTIFSGWGTWTFATHSKVPGRAGVLPLHPV